MSFDLTTQTGRDSIVSGREPKWLRMREGLHLGFRRMKAGADGHWTARATVQRQKHVRALGPEASMTYTEAQAAARSFADSLGLTDTVKAADLTVKPTTVAQAVKSIADKVRPGNPGKAAHYDQALALLSVPVDGIVLADRDLSRVTPEHVEAFYTALAAGQITGSQLKASSVLRYWGRVRAAVRKSVATFRYAANLSAWAIAGTDSTDTEDLEVREVLSPEQIRAVLNALPDHDRRSLRP